jgi:hypothetical protein
LPTAEPPLNTLRLLPSSFIVCQPENPLLGTPQILDTFVGVYTCRLGFQYFPPCTVSAPPPPIDFPFCVCNKKQGRTAFEIAPLIVASPMVGSLMNYTFALNSADCKGKACGADLSKVEFWFNAACFKAVKKTYFADASQSPSWGEGRQVLKVQTPLSPGGTGMITIELDTSICELAEACANFGGSSCAVVLFDPSLDMCPMYFAVAPGWMDGYRH